MSMIQSKFKMKNKQSNVLNQTMANVEIMKFLTANLLIASLLLTEPKIEILLLIYFPCALLQYLARHKLCIFVEK